MKNDTDTYVASNTSDVGYHQMHLNAVYDLLEERYVDVLVQPRAVFHEREAFITFLLRNPFPGKSIYLADRGYFSINVLAYLMMAVQPFVFRINSEEVKIPSLNTLICLMKRTSTLISILRSHVALKESTRMIRKNISASGRTEDSILLMLMTELQHFLSQYVW